MMTQIAEIIANRMDNTKPTGRYGYFIRSNYYYLVISETSLLFVLNHVGFIISKTPIKPPAIVIISDTLTFSFINKYASIGVTNTDKRESETD